MAARRPWEKIGSRRQCSGGRYLSRIGAKKCGHSCKINPTQEVSEDELEDIKNKRVHFLSKVHFLFVCKGRLYTQRVHFLSRVHFLFVSKCRLSKSLFLPSSLSVHASVCPSVCPSQNFRLAISQIFLSAGRSLW